MKKIIILVLILILSFTAFPEGSKQITYLNNMIGLTFEYPNSWNVITLSDYITEVSENKERKLSDEEINNIKENMPAFGILKYKEPVDFYNPSIIITLIPYDSGEKENDLKKLTAMYLNYQEKNLKNFSLLEQAKKYKLGNVNSSYSKFNYTYNFNETDHLIFEEVWFIHIGKITGEDAYFLQIEASTLENEGTGTRKEIYDILNTIRIK